MDLVLRCKRCGDVIGTYEPIVVFENGEVRETSKAAERDAAREWTEPYHRDCYIADQTAGDADPSPGSNDSPGTDRRR